ncbi:hypothetical protein BK809_0000322 [Diplodia seriata]|nr:hypothetical protein BK809_0000322 [Diplodia seriata]
MGFDCGFDIYPRLDPTPSNKEKYAHFINEVLRTYEDEDEYGSDSVVEVVPDSPGSHIEFLVGEHPAIPYNCEYFLRFSSKVSGKDGAQVERYIKEVCKMATKRFGDCVHFWHELKETGNDHDQFGYYSWKEVNESWRKMKELK